MDLLSTFFDLIETEIQFKTYALCRSVSGAASPILRLAAISLAL